MPTTKDRELPNTRASMRAVARKRDRAERQRQADDAMDDLIRQSVQTHGAWNYPLAINTLMTTKSVGAIGLP